jgi:hypothetical protein
VVSCVASVRGGTALQWIRSARQVDRRWCVVEGWAPFGVVRLLPSENDILAAPWPIGQGSTVNCRDLCSAGTTTAVLDQEQ